MRFVLRAYVGTLAIIVVPGLLVVSIIGLRMRELLTWAAIPAYSIASVFLLGEATNILRLPFGLPAFALLLFRSGKRSRPRCTAPPSTPATSTPARPLMASRAAHSWLRTTEYPSHLRLSLTATDSGGLVADDVRRPLPADQHADPRFQPRRVRRSRSEVPAASPRSAPPSSPTGSSRSTRPDQTIGGQAYLSPAGPTAAPPPMTSSSPETPPSPRTSPHHKRCTKPEGTAVQVAQLARLVVAFGEVGHVSRCVGVEAATGCGPDPRARCCRPVGEVGVVVASAMGLRDDVVDLGARCSAT